MFRSIMIISLLTLGACAIPGKYRADGTPEYAWNYTRTYLDTQALNEVSGAAFSRKTDRHLWLINDSGDSASLYALNIEGNLVGKFEVEGAENIDWEDLSIYNDNGKSILVVGDIGDNAENRSEYTLYFIEEPDINSNLSHITQRVRPIRTIRFKYEDVSNDSESMAIDTEQQRILLASKRHQKNFLYSLPLATSDTDIQTAHRITELSAINQSNHFFFLPRDKQQLAERAPTAMEISPDHRYLTILTYAAMFLFEKEPGERWENALNRKPVSSYMPALKQAEAITIGPDSKSIYVLSEKLPTVLVTLTPKTDTSFATKE